MSAGDLRASGKGAVVEDNSWVELTPYQLATIAAQERFKGDKDLKALKGAYELWQEAVRVMTNMKEKGS